MPEFEQIWKSSYPSALNFEIIAVFQEQQSNIILTKFKLISKSNIRPGGSNHKKNKEKIDQNPTTVKQPKTESELSKKLLYSFQSENSCDRKQLEAENKSEVAYEMRVSGKFSEIGAGTEKDSLTQVMVTNSNQYFIMNKETVSNRPTQTLASSYS